MWLCGAKPVPRVQVAAGRVRKQTDVCGLGCPVTEIAQQGAEDRRSETRAAVGWVNSHVDDLKEESTVSHNAAHAYRLGLS